MKAIEFKEQNVIIAKDQKEYQPLPAYAQNNGMVTFCFELDEKELREIKDRNTITFSFLTFKRPMQPINVSLFKPSFPVSHETPFVCSPDYWTEDSQAVYAFKLNKVMLGNKKHLWITVVTFGSPLQPIKLF
jgi:hypothetical protein